VLLTFNQGVAGSRPARPTVNLSSQFTNYLPRIEHIRGSVVLDANLDIVRDKTGRIMLEPWAYIDA
jgi:hypothetical protein